jgi:hypothetical protein
VQSSPGTFEAARTIEALRLGVVPHADLRSSSVGRDRELELTRLDLEEARGDGGSARVLLGDYGAGKTHMLEIIEREALARGFVVGRATLNADFLLPNHPMRIYRAVVTSLITPGQETKASAGLEPLLRAATTRDPIMTSVARRTAPIGDHLYLGPALHYFAPVDQLEDPVPRELLIDWISGHRPEGNRELDTTLRALARATRSFSIGPRVYALKDFQPWAHVYAYLLGGLAVLARETGHGGLVVLLDESESYDLLGSAARSFADSLFACLALAALGPGRTLLAESSLDKGGFGPQRRLPTRYSASQPLYVVSAMTPSTAGEQLLRQLVPPDRLSELTPLDQASYHELSRRITTVFEQAYPEMDLAERLSAPLGDVLWNLIDHNHIGSPREATKLTVEMLDLLRLRPDALPSFLGDVQRALR